MQKIIYPNLAIYQICNPLVFLATYWNLSLKSGNVKKIPCKSGKFRPIFFMTKLLQYRSKLYLSGWNLAKIRKQRQNFLNSPELKGERKSDIP
jgi:hypothetical protein